ncbi:MAG: glycosyltransferase family 4 protein [Caldilineaceae bacterium]|nr:glycosyltransferase family 4 protein [Caldilineaceae bacterium]
MRQGSAKVGYWIFNYAPKWEAASKEVETLSTQLADTFDTSVISLNLKTQRIGLRGRVKYLPLPYALLGLPVLSNVASRYQINHIFASPGERLLLPRLNKFNMVLTITKDTNSLGDFEKNAENLKKVKHIVVESKWHEELLLQLGIEHPAIHRIYPGTEIKPYQPATGPFKILFATSPPDLHGFLSRGVYLLIQTAKQLPQVRFVLVWRERNYEKLANLLAEADVSNVDVLNGYIPNMDEVYASVHAAILPGLATNSLKPCPHSGLDALAHGKPVLVSRPTSIADLIHKNRCGLAFEPSVECLEKAILELAANYDLFQRNCHATIKRSFSPDYFLAQYRQIYDSML